MYVNSEAQTREQRVVNLEYLANIVGQDIKPFLTYLPGLVDLLALSRHLCCGLGQRVLCYSLDRPLSQLHSLCTCRDRLQSFSSACQRDFGA